MNQRIIYSTDDGGVAVIVPAAECGLSIEEIAAKDVPAGKPYKIVSVAGIPSDRLFRNAWDMKTQKITVDIGKAKTIAHDIRRAKRAAEFSPLDVKATIPHEAAAADASRQTIREKYATIQTQIDGATNVDELKQVVKALTDNFPPA